MLSRLLERIEERDAKVVVVGLGYVGLPLAMAFAEVGFRVTGVDVDSNKVNGINESRSPVMDVPSHRLATALENGTFAATCNFGVVSEADAVVLCVPTPLGKNREPDLSFIRSAFESTLPHLRKGTLLALESTTYPGTTEELIGEALTQAGWSLGSDVFVCFSPERVDPGNKCFNTQNTPKVIGGVTKRCLEAGVQLYGTCIDRVIPVSSTRAAEMSKLLENTFRSVNIAFVNEMALLCERLGISIWEVLDAASTKPFGFMPFYPGPGIGGHCIPLDPAYLAWKAKEQKFSSRFIELAQEVNEAMPRHVLRQVSDILNLRGKAINGSRIHVLGMAYKPDVDDLRESPSLEVYELLVKAGAKVTVSDPYVMGFVDFNGQFIPSVPLTDTVLKLSDCALILTQHSCVDYSFVVRNANLVLDTRNAIRTPEPNVFRLGAPLPDIVGSVSRRD